MINDDIASKDKTIVKFLVGAVIVNNPQLRLFRNKLGLLTWISKRDSRRFEFLPSTVDEEEARNWHRTMATILPLFAVLSKRRTRSAKMGKIERIATWVEIAIDHEFLHSLRISIPLLRKARALNLWSSCCTRESSKNRNSPIFYCTSRLFIHSIYFCLLVTWKRLGERLINTHLFEENFITCVYHGLNKTCWKNLKKAF